MHNLEAIKSSILDGSVTFNQVVEDSKKYLGGGQYQHIGTHITPEGREAGWIYEYPFLKFNGVMYRDAGKTIEVGLRDGHLELDVRVTTAF